MFRIQSSKVQKKNPGEWYPDTAKRQSRAFFFKEITTFSRGEAFRAGELWWSQRVQVGFRYLLMLSSYVMFVAFGAAAFF